MSRKSRSERESLYAELGDEVRAGQRATDVIDELVCQLMRINRTDARCLDILDQHGDMTAGELAKASGLTTGAITAVLDRLEEAGWAERVPDPEDRRRVRVILTSDAQETIMELMAQPMATLWRPMADRYSDEELRLFIDFTRRGREIQERHADWLRERLAAKARERRRPGTRTEPA